ncbi:MAG TPA: S1C family serine protease [Armatimonadota bacterium]|jgi:S1-C subfamily serine protease
MLVALSLCLLSLCTRATAAEALTTAQIAEQALPAVVAITVKTADGEVNGSGTIIDGNGTILTCFHLIERAKSAFAKFSNGGYFPVRGMLGFNPAQDIGVLQIQGKALPTLPLGDSAAVKPGEKVVAIGCPRGLDYTVSDGIVSAIRKVGDCPEAIKKELLKSGRKEEDELIQFTAPISPGNSGGPLLDSQGRIIGIVIIGVTIADNVYFAVPINAAKPLLSNQVVTKFGEIDLSAIGGPKQTVAPRTKDFGISDLETVSLTYTIPKGKMQVWGAASGYYQIDWDTLSITSEDGKAFTKVSKGPLKKSEYTVVIVNPLKVVIFSEKDTNHTVVISFKARRYRVAILPTVNQSSINAAPMYTQDAITSIYADLGYILISPREITTVLHDKKINVDELVSGTRGSAREDEITTLGTELNAYHILFSKVDMEFPRKGTTDYNFAGLLVLFDGETGKSLFTKSKQISDLYIIIMGNTDKQIANSIFRVFDQMFCEYFHYSRYGTHCVVQM